MYELSDISRTDIIVRRMYDGPIYVGNEVGLFVQYEMNVSKTALFADAFRKPKYSHSDSSLQFKKHLPFIKNINRGYRQSLLQMIASGLEYVVDEIKEYEDGLTINSAECVVAYRLTQEQLMEFMQPHKHNRKNV